MATGIDNYRRSLRAAVRGLWLGVLDFDQFIDTMMATIKRRLTQAWHEGAAECGVAPGELTPRERMTLDNRITGELRYVSKLAARVEDQSKARGGKLTPLLSPLSIWINRYNDMRNQARISACENRKLIWVVDRSKESCQSCLRLEHKVKRGSFWQRTGIRPQHPPNSKLD